MKDLKYIFTYYNLSYKTNNYTLTLLPTNSVFQCKFKFMEDYINTEFKYYWRDTRVDDFSLLYILQQLPKRIF